MARVNNIIMNGVSGRIGDLVFFNRDGKTFVRPYQKSELFPSKWRLMKKFLTPLRVLINDANKNRATKTHAFDRIFKENLRQAVTGDLSGFRINYSRLVLSKGPKKRGPKVWASLPSEGKISIHWDNRVASKGLPLKDKVFAACYCAEIDQWLGGTTGAIRKDGSCMLDHSAYRGKSFHVYFGFISWNQRTTYDSVYLGELKVE